MAESFCFFNCLLDGERFTVTGALYSRTCQILHVPAEPFVFIFAIPFLLPVSFRHVTPVSLFSPLSLLKTRQAGRFFVQTMLFYTKKCGAERVEKRKYKFFQKNC